MEHRVPLKQTTTEPDVCVVWECKVIVPGPHGRPQQNSRLLIATAGYKDGLIIGTEDMYRGGHMVTFEPSTGIWYKMSQRDSMDIHVFMYRKDDNLYAYIGYDLKWDFNPKFYKPSPEVTENLLLTPIELVALNKLKKRATKEFEERIMLGHYE